ncbi:hypothetical protein FOA43_002168 [Brettanomyces nanus]|uniref:Uncharacterized protein n=1 Tax=Eeniella nana TaxID=13502 RepID=A0A875S439_EENNA|nr:uncharacterized protein FOA43_002168 [Brettanomyces nanus]QPG74832.1 hypothetical protein FOA43_002168 [Brettanomyces nanus]
MTSIAPPRPVSSSRENYHYAKYTPKKPSIPAADDSEEFSSSSSNASEEEEEDVEPLPVISSEAVKKAHEQLTSRRNSLQPVHPVQPSQPRRTTEAAATRPKARPPVEQSRFIQASSTPVNFKQVQKNAALNNVNRNLAQTLRKFSEEEDDEKREDRDNEHHEDEDALTNNNLFKELTEKRKEVGNLQLELDKYKRLVREMKSSTESQENEISTLKKDLQNVVTKFRKLYGNEEDKLNIEFGKNWDSLELNKVENLTWVEATNDIKNVLNRFGVKYEDLRNRVKFISEKEFWFISELHKVLHGNELKGEEEMRECMDVMMDEIRQLVKLAR